MKNQQKNVKPKFSLSDEEIRAKLDSDPDFVFMKRFGNSIAQLEERYPQGCPDHIAAQALCLEVDQFHLWYEGIVAKLQELMGVEKDV
jgi:hypothetical protein